MPENNNNKRYARKPASGTVLVIGGVVIAIAGLGAYYIWSIQELLRKAEYWVKEYQREYQEFLEDSITPGVITPEEQALLDEKKRLLTTIINEIEAKGLIEQFTDLLWSIGIVITVVTVARIIAELIRDYFRRNPRDPKPPHTPPPDPANPYKDVTDDTWHPSENDLRDHYRETHPTPGDDPNAWNDVFTDLRELPEWFLSLLSSFNLDGLEYWIEHDYRELDPNVQLALKFLLGAALVIAICLVGWYAGPVVMDKVQSILAKLDAIPA